MEEVYARTGVGFGYEPWRRRARQRIRDSGVGPRAEIPRRVSCRFSALGLESAMGAQLSSLHSCDLRSCDSGCDCPSWDGTASHDSDRSKQQFRNEWDRALRNSKQDKRRGFAVPPHAPGFSARAPNVGSRAGHAHPESAGPQHPHHHPPHPHQHHNSSVATGVGRPRHGDLA